MNTLSYKTPSANKKTVQKEWVLIDATGQPLGRLASKVAKLLRGKYKPNFTPHVDCGDNVVIINVDKVILTGKKMTDKVYLRYSGYPGGQRSITPEKLVQRPRGYERMVRHAVKGMLPKSILGARLLKNLYLYQGEEHLQTAQQPKPLDLSSIK
ncbi:MAG: 50S ribosomal protein L13 [Prevotellaceae bacterium]|nr:50S ribosomal protein L13 [Prevotellaceae bacterium]MCD8303255.1 50S ribosomal protein L13 [Prevotellaceae bacterium]